MSRDRARPSSTCRRRSGCPRVRRALRRTRTTASFEVDVLPEQRGRLAGAQPEAQREGEHHTPFDSRSCSADKQRGGRALSGCRALRFTGGRFEVISALRATLRLTLPRRTAKAITRCSGAADLAQRCRRQRLVLAFCELVEHLPSTSSTVSLASLILPRCSTIKPRCPSGRSPSSTAPATPSPLDVRAGEGPKTTEGLDRLGHGHHLFVVDRDANLVMLAISLSSFPSEASRPVCFLGDDDVGRLPPIRDGADPTGRGPLSWIHGACGRGLGLAAAERRPCRAGGDPTPGCSSFGAWLFFSCCAGSPVLVRRHRH